MSSGAEASSSARIFILGSCVTRDAFAFDEGGFELAGYVARTSLASAFLAGEAPAELLKCAGGLKSTFQRRMVETDLRKNASGLIASSGYDYLVLDLVDERFHLAKVGGSVATPLLVTMSAELSKLYRAGSRVLRSGSAAHWSAWLRGVDALLTQVPAERIIVNPVLWAERTVAGDALEDQASIAAANAYLERMYDHLLSGLGLRSIRYRGAFLADPDHQWGLAPFHYHHTVYEQTMAQLRHLAACRKAYEERA